MSLAAGDQLGHYQILSRIGKGGMGEVFKAHDPRVGRDVAIKVSAKQFSERFDREVRAIAALNHPNICTLYDVGPNYLVMEFVDGVSPKGPLPLDEALAIAKQITAALEAAHEKNITHRDLKPANIMVKADGLVKVLDFGLAKFTEPSSTDSGPEAPTLTMGLSAVGAIMGTPAYMSPEQARGKEIDKRSDIWAFGVVFHELLTGKRLFQGEDLTETLASVVMKEPELSGVPVEVRKLLTKCLQKDPRKRLRDIGDVWELLESPSEAAPVQIEKRAPRRWPWIAATATLLVLAPANLLHWRETPPAAQLMRFEVPAPEGTNFYNKPVLSPDGRMLAFAASSETDGRTMLWVRNLDTLAARALPGTDGVNSPVFWSPDSRSLAYSGATIGKLMRVEVAGGPPQTLCSAFSNAPYGSWGAAGVVVFRYDNGVYQVPAAGGDCTPITKVDQKRGEVRHTAPVFLPDGRHFLYLRLMSTPAESGFYIGSLDAAPEQQETTRLLTATSGIEYVPSASDRQTGYLLFRREGSLMSQPFDPERRVLLGDAVPIAEQVGASDDYGYFSASSTGILSYRGGGAEGNSRLTWYDRSGKAINVTDVGSYTTLAISPDGTRAAVQRAVQGQADIWIHEFARGTNEKLSFDPSTELSPVWSPKGDRVVYASRRDGVENLYEKVSNNAGEEQAVLKSERRKFPMHWSRDGNFLLYQDIGSKTNWDLWVLPMNGKDPGEPKPFLATAASESQGQFSPDGRFIAYTSDATGQSQIYVRPFSPDGKATGQWMVSITGGVQPRWSPDGRELFFISPNSELMSAPVSLAGGTFRPGTAAKLFPVPLAGGPNIQSMRWDVAPDGKRFLFAVTGASSDSLPVNVVVNWQELLKK